ncbi:hypothetical protein [Sporichthya polymorpha]|uniref:hypothetical protein n=1 Tax=Sporichthya polymorpha TaxID=35751 RepID=UPI000371F438|nr:hypothetical protein [Sporichthya polymorpha]
MANGSPDPDAARSPDTDLDRLRHLAYVALPPALGRTRRARVADDLARRNLADGARWSTARDRLIPEVLRVSPHPSGAGALAARVRPRGPESPAETALAAMTPATRAAYVLTRLEGVRGERAEALLRQAGVTDPRTAVSMAERADLSPEDVRAVVVPVVTSTRRPRIIAAAAAALVVGVAAPVIAVSTSGGSDDAPEQVSNQAPVQQQPDADAIAKAVQLDRDLRRILDRLDDELARPDQNKAEIQRLRTLRAAVLAEQKRLGGSTP